MEKFAFAHPPAADREKDEKSLPPEQAGGQHVAVAAAAAADVGAQRKVLQQLKVFLDLLRLFEILAGRQGAHALAQPGRDLAFPPLQKIDGVHDLPPVAGAVARARAGSRAALDVVE